jgi:hypothetical protein
MVATNIHCSSLIRYQKVCVHKVPQFVTLTIFWVDNRVIGKGRQTKHQNPEFEFGHTQGEIPKKPAKKYISIQGGGAGGLKLRKPSILVVN